jgi:hypothetical protein
VSGSVAAGESGVDRGHRGIGPFLRWRLGIDDVLDQLNEQASGSRPHCTNAPDQAWAKPCAAVSHVAPSSVCRTAASLSSA